MPKVEETLASYLSTESSSSIKSPILSTKPVRITSEGISPNSCQILLWSQGKLLSLRATFIPGAHNIGADILSRADMEGVRPGTSGSVCVSRDVSLSILVLPHASSPRDDTDMAEVSSVCISPDCSAPRSTGESSPGPGPTTSYCPRWLGRVWFLDALQRVVRLAERISGSALPSLQDIYIKRCKSRAAKIIKDSNYPGKHFFISLPSGKRFRSMMAKTERLRRSFFPQTIRLLNSVS